MRRPEGVTMIAIWYFLQTACCVLGLGGMTLGFLGVWADSSGWEDVLFGTLGMVLGVMAILGVGAVYLIAGLGLWRMREWSRSVAIVMAALQLIVVPFGTIAGIMILVYLNRNEEAKRAFGLSPNQTA